MKGIGVLINELCGNQKESLEAYQFALNKTISKLKIEDDALKIFFSGGGGIKIYDDGQSCCESRYMNTDDDLKYFIGSIFLEVLVNPVEYKQEEYEDHEIQFLEIKTNKGVFSIANHNEHNGYYGGFWIKMEKISTEK